LYSVCDIIHNEIVDQMPWYQFADIQQLQFEAQHRWLRPAEICEILRNYQMFQITSEPHNRPPSMVTACYLYINLHQYILFIYGLDELPKKLSLTDFPW